MGTRPTLIETEAYKRWEKELGKPPKIRVFPLKKTKEEKEKAKLVQKLINYMFETNADGFTSKYYAYMKLQQREWLEKQTSELKFNWDAVERALKPLIKK